MLGHKNHMHYREGTESPYTESLKGKSWIVLIGQTIDYNELPVLHSK